MRLPPVDHVIRKDAVPIGAKHVHVHDAALGFEETHRPVALAIHFGPPVVHCPLRHIHPRIGPVLLAQLF